MGGGFRFGVPLCGWLICPGNERFALQAAFTSSVCEKEETHHEYWYLQVSGQQILESLYKAVVSGIDKSKLPERMAEAEKAVVLRARELFHAAGDNGEETEALEDVMYALHALGSNCQMQ